LAQGDAFRTQSPSRYGSRSPAQRFHVWPEPVESHLATDRYLSAQQRGGICFRLLRWWSDSDQGSTFIDHRRDPWAAALTRAAEKMTNRWHQIRGNSRVVKRAGCRGRLARKCESRSHWSEATYAPIAIRSSSFSFST